MARNPSWAGITRRDCSDAEDDIASCRCGPCDSHTALERLGGSGAKVESDYALSWRDSVSRAEEQCKCRRTIALASRRACRFGDAIDA